MVENLGSNLSLLAIFLEGLLSFLSPCIFPLIPLYISYLSADAKEENEQGNIRYRHGRIFFTTLCFVLGISSVFLLYGLSLQIIREFLERYQEVFSIVGGILLILLAMHHFGWIEWKFLHQEKRLPFRAEGGMSYGKAFLFGFFFSFAWTPCIGPILSGVLLLAANQASYAIYYLLAYVLGLTLPFLLLGIFTKSLLEFINKRKNIVRYTMKIAAFILLIFGLNTFYDGVKKIDILKAVNKVETTTVNDEKDTAEGSNDFRSIVFTDHKGINYQLKNDEGEIIYLNFMATWCHYCKQEIPHFEAFIKEKNARGYYVMSPSVNQSTDVESLKEFAKEHEMTLPILVDEDNRLFAGFSVAAFPTLVVIDPAGKPFSPIQGMLTEEQLRYIHTKVLEKVAENK